MQLFSGTVPSDEVVRRYQKMEPARWSGPVPVTDRSYPFSSIRHCREPLDLSEYGYMEEEYFLEGEAALYAREGDRLVLEREPQVYRNRVLVRYPSDPEKFSGRVYADILNATNRYDFEDLWQRIYLWCLRSGHAYVGITSKPVNVDALRRFDPERYRTLTWPRCPDGEEAQGAFWDILTQTALAAREGGKEDSACPFKGYPVKSLYLSGQSQSGAYLNTYLANFYSLVRDRFPGLYDGFINLVGVQFGRPVGQDKEEPLTFGYREEFHTDVPYLGITSEGDFGLFPAFGCPDLYRYCPADADEETNRCRYYEIGGAPHYDAFCPVIPCDEDIRRAGGNPPVVPEDKNTQNHFPLRDYMTALIERLHRWAGQGGAPPSVPALEKEKDGTLRRDAHGNVLGGLRSPWLDVPDAVYIGSGSLPGTDAAGLRIPFTEEKMRQLYTAPEAYRERFEKALQRQVEEGWLLP